MVEKINKELRFDKNQIRKLENKLFNKIKNNKLIDDIVYLKFTNKELNEFFNYRLNEFYHNLRITEIFDNKIKKFQILIKINENYKTYYFNDLNQLFNYLKNFNNDNLKNFLN